MRRRMATRCYWSAPPNTINATLYDQLNFNFIRDIVPVAGILRTFYIMVVHPSFPAKTVSEFIAYAKANPGKISYRFGRHRHFATRVGRAVQDDDRCADAACALSRRCAGDDRSDWRTGAGHVRQHGHRRSSTSRSGKLRALAVTTATRVQAAAGLADHCRVRAGIMRQALGSASARRGTRRPKSSTMLNKEINAGLADPKIKVTARSTRRMVIAGSPADFGKLIADETEKWGKVIRAANIKPE